MIVAPVRPRSRAVIALTADPRRPLTVQYPGRAPSHGRRACVSCWIVLVEMLSLLGIFAATIWLKMAPLAG